MSPGPTFLPNVELVRPRSVVPKIGNFKRFPDVKTVSGRRIPFGKRLKPNKRSEKFRLQMSRSMPNFRTDGRHDGRTSFVYKKDSTKTVRRWDETGRSDWVNASSQDCMKKYGVMLKPSSRARGTADVSAYDFANFRTGGIRPRTAGGKWSTTPRWNRRAEQRMKMARRMAKAMRLEQTYGSFGRSRRTRSKLGKSSSLGGGGPGRY